MATLPMPKRLKVPREKPVPQPKPLTRWEEFAKRKVGPLRLLSLLHPTTALSILRVTLLFLKGIKKVKKSIMVYDEASGEYKPRWGYKRANNELDVPWVEVPDNAG